MLKLRYDVHMKMKSAITLLMVAAMPWACSDSTNNPPPRDASVDRLAPDTAPADLSAEDVVTSDVGPTTRQIRGRFESAGPVRQCHQVVSWSAPDGLLLRPVMNTCGDDMQALAATILANLDAAKAKGQRALLVIGQGINLPASWLGRCQTFKIEDPRFTGDICLPWDASYQADLRAALVDTIGPAIDGHEALAGVYFTITTMTNGSEMHFRVPKASFPYPGDAVFRGAYDAVMDIYQEAFSVPIVFEAGHCLFSDSVDCETPAHLYRYARDTYGKENTGIALWNCAERFWAADGAGEETFGVKELIEEASRDGVSIGCQTVGSFTNGACRFTDPDVAEYGARGNEMGDNCPTDDPNFDPEAACIDTLNWFTGTSTKNATSAAVRGTWGEIWSVDVNSDGIYRTSAACAAAIDQLATL